MLPPPVPVGEEDVLPAGAPPADWYGENYYQNAPPENPTGPVSGQYRVLRGGSFDEHDEYQARPTFRFIEAPDESKDDAGFRCVLPE